MADQPAWMAPAASWAAELPMKTAASGGIPSPSRAASKMRGSGLKALMSPADDHAVDAIFQTDGVDFAPLHVAGAVGDDAGDLEAFVCPADRFVGVGI